MEGGRNLPLFPFRDGDQNLIKTITQICMCVRVCVIAFSFHNLRAQPTLNVCSVFKQLRTRKYA